MNFFKLLLVPICLCLLTTHAKSATIKKQKKCKVIIKDASDLKSKKIYSFKKDDQKAKVKITKTKGSSALGVVSKKNCKKDLKGFSYSANENQAKNTPTGINHSFSAKGKLGALLGGIKFNDDTNIIIAGFDSSIVSSYHLHLGSIDMPISAGLSHSQANGSLSDDNGDIVISGDHISLRLGTGIKTRPISLGFVDLAFGFSAGIDYGVSTTITAVFSSLEGAGFPGSFEDANGNDLGSEIIATGTTGLGFYSDLEALASISEAFQIGAFIGYKQFGQAIVFDLPQPFVESTTSQQENLIEGGSVSAYSAGLIIYWGF